MSGGVDRLIVPGEAPLHLVNGFSQEHPFGPPFDVSYRNVELTDKERKLGPQTLKVYENYIHRLPPWYINPDETITYGIKALKKEPVISDLDGQDPVDPRIVYEGKFDLKSLNNEVISDELASVLRLFKFTEDYLPDYTRGMMQIGRNYHGVTLTAYQWSNEEGDHSIVLGEILKRTGRSTPEELETLYLDQQVKTLEMPFETIEEFQGFGVLQESFAYTHYEIAAKKADMEGAHNTAFLLRLIGSVEAYHAKGYRVMIDVFAAHDRDAMRRGLLRPGANFRWPAEHLQDRRGKVEAFRAGTKVGMLMGDDYRNQIYRTLSSFPGIISKEEAAAAADHCMRKKVA